MDKITKSKLGKASRAAGNRFEKRVRVDLELKGWVVDKWSNQVVFEEEEDKFYKGSTGLLKPAKHKFRGIGIPMAMGTGFPDFLCMRRFKPTNYFDNSYEVIGVESKMKGVLDKQEKEKCDWLLKNNIFSKIVIASKGEKRGEIIYKEYEVKKNINK